MMCSIFSVNIKCVRLVSHIHDPFEVQINEPYERTREYVIKSHKHLYLYREVLIARDRHLNSEDCILVRVHF